MNNGGESRESLDLLASAAEQSSESPQARIKRNTACVSCRDSKVKCNASTVPGQPCQRCAKLKLSCVVDKSHKRVSKRSKFEELVQEVQNIKQAVAPRTPSTTPQLPLPAIPTPQPQHASPRSEQSRIYTTASFSAGTTPLSTIPSFTAPPAPRAIPDAASGPALAPSGQMTTPSSAASSQPRALKSRVFASQDIDFYFEKYFEFFHPYLPIVRTREPDAIYNSGPVLFWVIMVTACRKSPHDGGVFDFLVDSVKSEVWEAVSEPPMSLATMNALLILSAWPLPTIRLMTDPSLLFSSLLANSCYLLGIHTGRGDFPAITYPAYRLSVSNEEAVYTWVGYNIVSQRISTYSGTPATGQFFNKTIESVLDRTSPVRLPMYFCVLLESAAFLHRLSRSMAAHLEEGRGISHHIVDHFVEDFGKVERLLSADDTSEVDRFTILSTLLEIQIYYFMPVPGFSQEIFKRCALRCYTTAQALVRLALQLQSNIAFLSHAPHFVCRSMLAAGCVIISTLISPSLKDLVEGHIREEGLATPDTIVSEAFASIRYCSVQEGDLPARASKMLESAWNVRSMLPPTEFSHLGSMPEYTHRLGMGLPMSCIRRWKIAMEQMRPEKCNNQAGGHAGSGGGGGGIAAADVAGTGAAVGVPDPVTMIDWDAFMKDFDWNFESSLMDAVVPT